MLCKSDAHRLHSVLLAAVIAVALGMMLRQLDDLRFAHSNYSYISVSVQYFSDGEYFVAKNVASGMVLDAKGGGVSPGTQLILWKEKPRGKFTGNYNQMFYEHPESGTLLSVLNHLTINISREYMIITNYGGGVQLNYI